MTYIVPYINWLYRRSSEASTVGMVYFPLHEWTMFMVISYGKYTVLKYTLGIPKM